MICPACRKHIKPFPLTLWPGATVNVCPKCRIGLGTLTTTNISKAAKLLSTLRTTHKPPKQ